MLETVAFTPEAIQNDMEFDTNTGAKVPKLAKPDDWLNWYPAIQSIGISKGVWQWATPDEPDSKIPPPPLIKPPSIEQFLTDQKKEDNAAKKEKEEKSEFFSSSATKEAESGSSHGIDINQLSQANQERYMNAWKLYRMAYQEYEGPMEYLASVIYNSVSTNAQMLIRQVQRNPRQMLLKLKARYGPNNDLRRSELRKKWQEKGRIPRQRMTMDKMNDWLDSWLALYLESESSGLEIRGRGAIERFASVACSISEHWCSTYEQLIKQKPDLTFEEAVESFRSHYDFRWTIMRNVKPLDATFATFQGRSQNDEEDDDGDGDSDSKKNSDSTNQNTGKRGSNNRSNRSRKCLACGQRHPVSKCWGITDEDRPDDWYPSNQIIEKIQKALGDADTKKKIEDALKKAKKEFKPIAEATEKPERTLMASLSLNEKDALYNSVVADTASTTHVCNDLSRMSDVRPAPPGRFLKVGNTEVEIEAYGTFRFKGTAPNGSKVPIALKDAVYVTGFHCNILSLSKAEKSGIYLDTRRRMLIEADGTPFVKLEKHDDMYTVEYHPVEEKDRVFATVGRQYRRSAMPKQLVGTESEWHNRLGHLHRKAVRKLAEMATGITIINGPDTSCTTCPLAESKKQISRRSLERSKRPFQRVYYDLIELEEAWNHHRWLSHFLDDCTRMNWGITHEKKSDAFRSIKMFDKHVERRYDLKVREYHLDGERLGDKWEFYLEEVGVGERRTVPYTPEQNGPSERIGYEIVKRARAILIEANLPRQLGLEACKATIYLINRTPVRFPDSEPKDGRNESDHDCWYIPLQRFRQPLGINKPIDVSNLYKFGSLAYYRRNNIPRSHKMEPRAAIGYLIGYESYNIWRLFNPKALPAHRVFRARDVVFDESRKYDPNDPLLTTGLRYAFPEETADSNAAPEVEIPPMLMSVDLDELESVNQNDPAGESSTPVTGSGGGVDTMTVNQIEPVTDVATDTSYHSPTDYETPPSDWSDRDIQNTQFGEDGIGLPGGFPKLDYGPDESDDEDDLPTPVPLSPPTVIHEGHEFAIQKQPILDDPTAIEYPDPLLREVPEEDRMAAQPPLVQDQRDMDLDSNLRLKRRPSRSPDRDRSPTRRRTFYTYMLNRKPDSFAGLNYAFYSSLSKKGKPDPEPELANQKLHRDQLPKPPQTWREMMNHPFKNQWLKASHDEIGNLTELGCYEMVDAPKQSLVIPLKWVWTYKFDEEGFLVKFKARICVRGDLQPPTRADTAAATLAARLFRMMMALAAVFDLDITQLDVVNAFIQGFMDELVYVGLPPGFFQKGKVWKLLRPLYGLRRSPRLWQKDISSTLRKFGFEQVPEEPCLFVKPKHKLIVMFFVDDILIFNPPTRFARKNAADFIRSMESAYKIRNLGEAKWFLNIRIIRDRPNRKLWLSQESYIEGLRSRYHLPELSKPPETPLPGTRLAPSPPDRQASKQDILLYQQMVGSYLYPTVMTRPDGAQAASELAKHLTNPGPEHLDAVRRAIQYLIATKSYAIEFTGKSIEAFVCASDASFADNPDRRSSEGYLIKMFGGPIDWRASRQKTVTTSTTEAELLAISEAGKQLFWWKRLFNAIEFDPEANLTIKCDNQQTVRLLTDDEPNITTKLRHVDIHRHWLREKVQNGDVKVEWVPTSQMPADGLTKPMFAPKHRVFIKQLGLVDISSFNSS